MKITVKNAIGGGESCELEIDGRATIQKMTRDAARTLAAGEPDKFDLALDGAILPKKATAKNAGLVDGATLLLMPKDAQGGC